MRQQLPRRLVLCLVVLLCFALPIEGQISTPQMRQETDLDRAKALIYKGEVSSATRLLNTASNNKSRPAVERAQALLFLAHLGVAKRDLPQATYFFRKAIETATPAGPEKVVALCQKAIFEFGWETRMPAMAELALDTGLSFASQITNVAQRGRVLAQLNERSGVFNWNGGSRRTATEKWQIALKFAKASQSIPSQFWATHHLAVAKFASGQGDDTARGFELARSALKLAMESGDKRLEARARFLLGEFAAPVPEDALAQLDSALKLVRQNPVSDTLLEVQILLAQAKATRRQNRIGAAGNLVRTALKLADGIPQSIQNEVRKEAELVGVSEAGVPPLPDFEAAHAALLPAIMLGSPRLTPQLCEDWLQKSPELLLEGLETSQVREIGRQLAAEGLQLTTGLSDSDRQREADTEVKLWLLKQAVTTQSIVPRAQGIAAIRQAQTELDAIRTSLFKQNPALAILRGGSTFSLQNLRGALANDTALLKFGRLFSRSGTTLWVAITITKNDTGELEIHPVLLTGNWADSVVGWKNVLSQNNSQSIKTAHEAYNTLIAPLEARLRGVKKLVLLPDGALWNLPFGALLNKSGAALGQNYEISLAASVTASLTRPATTVREAIIVANPATGGVARIAALSQSLRGDHMLQGRPITADGRALTANGRALTANGRDTDTDDSLLQKGSFRERPEAEAVAQEIVDTLKRGIVLTGQNATVANFRQACEGAGDDSVAHLDVHSFLLPDAPFRSAFVFAEAPASDGFLTLANIAAQKFPSEVVVNLTSESGTPTDGLEALPALSFALGAAGAKTAIVAYWPSGKTDTPAFWKEFYTQRMAGINVAAALKNAAVKSGYLPNEAARLKEVLCGF